MGDFRGFGRGFSKILVSDLGLGAAALLEAPRGLRAQAPRGPLGIEPFGEFLEPFRRVRPGFVRVIARGYFGD